MGGSRPERRQPPDSPSMALLGGGGLNYVKVPLLLVKRCHRSAVLCDAAACAVGICPAPAAAGEGRREHRASACSGDGMMPAPPLPGETEAKRAGAA